MMLPIRTSVMAKLRPEVRTLKSPRYHPTSKKTICITSRRCYFLARCTGTSLYKLQGLHCERNVDVPILLLHALCFQIPENHLGQWHHHCSNANSQPFTTIHPSPTMHHPPRRCHNPSLVETRMFHNPRPVQSRTFPNTKRLLLKKRKGSWKQLY